MRRIRSITAILLAACMGAGCTTPYTYVQTTLSAKNDLNQAGSSWISFSTWNTSDSEWNFTYMSYVLTDVHFSIVSPVVSPATTGPTTAVLINSGGSTSTSVFGTSFTTTSANSLKVLEFGTGSAITSTQNPFFSDSWATGLQSSGGATSDNLGTTLTFDSIKDVGNDAILSWGRWTDARYKVNNVDQSGCCSANKSAHYVLGAATSNADIAAQTGTATFNLIGATSPTVNDGSKPPGTVTAAQVGVQWGGAGSGTKVAIDLSGSVGGTAFQVKTPGGLPGIASSPITYNALTQSFSGNWLSLVGAPNASVSGFFAGAGATHVGLTYSAPLSTTVFVQGAAAFSR